MQFVAVLLVALSITSEEINSQVALLRSDDYQTREAAQQFLHDHLEEVIPTLQGLRADEDFEVRSRASLLIDVYGEMLLEPYEGILWIDLLPDDFCDRDTIIKRYLVKKERFYVENGDLCEGYPGYAEATRNFLFDALHGGEDHLYLKETLERMYQARRITFQPPSTLQ